MSEGSYNNDRLNQIEQQLEQQIQFNAELRTSFEISRNRDESRLAELAELRQTAEALLQVVQLHQRDIEVLAEAMRQHRSDGHGA